MEKEQAMASGAGLIYGLNDRPPLKETIFAAFAGYFCCYYYSTVDYCRSFKT